MPPKTPRTKAASKAPTTGHIASPATIVIRKKLTSTPAPLPKRGRKSMGFKHHHNDAMKTNQKHYNGFFRMYCRNKTF
jgi:hypothetical protein